MAVERRRATTAAVVWRVLLCVVLAAGCAGPAIDDSAAPVPSPSPSPNADPSLWVSPDPASTPRPDPSAGSSPAPTPGLPPWLTPSPSPDPWAPSPSPDASPTGPPTPTPAPSTTPGGTPTPEPDQSTTDAPADELRLGDEGPAVIALQERLLELGYWLPAVDGEFGGGTHHAVVALQKAAGIARDGIVGPVTAAALAEGARPLPRSTSGTLIEIDRSSQLLLLVEDGELRWAFDTSTGRPGLTTPAGWFHVDREIDGYRTSHLGVLYRPKYFNAGIAIHGYPSVPPYPASHGCVRVTNAAIDWFWAEGEAPVGRAVWVY